MNTTTLLVYLTLAEVGLLAIVVSVFLIIRARKIKQLSAPVTKKITETVVKTVEADIGLHINKLIQQTRYKLDSCDDKQAQFLDARLQFLEAESVLLAEDPASDDYWEIVTERLSSLFPASEAPIDTALAELDELDAFDEADEESRDNDENGAQQKGSITIDTSQQEIGRLRNIISRQHGSIDELKQMLEEKSQGSEQAEKLAKKLEQIEVAHAQLNMCIDVLEKENTRLKQKLKKPYDDNGADGELLAETRKKLDIANNRIDDLQEESNSKSERIHELEAEISRLQESLQKHEAELKRAELLSADLSRIDDEPETDPEVLKKQIEDITELLMKKSNELQQLQSGSGNSKSPDSTPVLRQNDIAENPEIETSRETHLDADSDVDIHSLDTDTLNDLEDNIPVLEENIVLINRSADDEIDITEVDSAEIDATVDMTLAQLETYEAEPSNSEQEPVDTIAELTDTDELVSASDIDLPVIEDLDDADIVMLDEFLDFADDEDSTEYNSTIEDDINEFLRQQEPDGADLEPQYLEALGIVDEQSDAKPAEESKSSSHSG